MAKNPGTQNDNTMNREVGSQWDSREGRQFSCHDSPYGENYYTVKYDANGNEITKSSDYTPDGDFFQSGSAERAVGDAGQFRGSFATADTERLAKQISEGEMSPHKDGFKVEQITVNVGRADRGKEQ